MYSWLAHSIAQSQVVVTGSRRLARELRHAYNERQLAVGQRAWPSPHILFVGDWLNELLDGVTDESAPLRIGAAASSVLWERCLSEQIDHELPGFGGLVRQCKQAWDRLQAWQIPIEVTQSYAAGPEQRQFVAAANRYCEIIAERHWVDDGGIPRVLSQFVPAGAVNLPESICLAGFDRITPAVQQFLDTIDAAGCHRTFADSGSVADRILLTSAGDGDAELRAAGAWAREVLSDDPAAKIAIVCPDLEKNSSRVARLVREGFAPGWQYAGAEFRSAVNVSYGSALASFPAISVALLLLRWVNEGLSSKEVSILLRSRSIVGGVISGRCRLEQQLRRHPDRQWRPGNLLAALADHLAGDDAATWCDSIRIIVVAGAQNQGRQSPAEWADRFDRILTSAGWPGTDPRDSHEFQLLNRWRELLNELARLEHVLPKTTFAEALARLTGLAGETIFQPESDPGVLPVLGMLETAGMAFDKVWVTGFDATRWPATGSPLAFVSRELQKKHEMPDATPLDTLAFAKRVLQRLLRSCDEIVFSWAISEDGVDQSPSPLADELSSIELADFVDPGWRARSLGSAHLLCDSSNSRIPPVVSEERIAGGAYTVQRQSSDPFSAFAYGRLRIGELPLFQPGLSASMRGSAIHRALSSLYRGLPDLADIAAWSDDERRRRARTAAEQSLVKLAKHADPVLRKIIDLEGARVQKMLVRFVTEEIAREPFRVAMIEQALIYERFGVRLDLRVDRVDMLENGGALVIDYKTGAEKSLLNRHGELNDLQLIIYALALSENIDGLALINLDSRKISYKAAIGGDAWDANFSAWTEVAEAAVQRLAAGDARVHIALPTDKGRPLNVLSRFEELRRG